jgi:protein O-GlcNAc transferase
MDKQKSFINMMQLAQRSHQSGDLAMAANLYKEALKLSPRNPDALQLLGIVYCSLHKYSEGINCLEKALNQQPDNPILLTNLSNAYYKTEEYTKALSLLQKTIQLKPDFDEAWHKIGNTLKALNKPNEAIEAYNKAISLNPNHYNAFYNLGNTHLHCGNYKTAISCYEKAILINPNFALAHNNVGIAFLEWDQVKKAEFHYLKAVQLNPAFKEAIKNLCLLYEKTGNEKQTVYWLNALSKLAPSETALQFYINTRSAVLYTTSEEIDHYQNAVTTYLQKALKDKPRTLQQYVEESCFPSPELIYQGKVCKDIKSLYDDFYSEIPKLKVNHKNNRCHAGFIVTAGHEGVFLKCMKGIINNLNTDQMAISIICSLPNGKKIIATEITNDNVQFVEIPSDINKAGQIILQAAIDILYYWEIGTDSLNYFLALTKPAPIQVTSWGWPITSGLKTVDYFISQKNLETLTSQQHYTEKLVVFEKIPTYYYRPPLPAISKPLSFYNLPENSVMYICQQNLRKVHPDFDKAVSELLNRDKNGRILFIKDKYEAITEKLQARLKAVTGRDYSRIIFIDRMNESDYLTVLSQCSIALDTFYYGGGANTVYDSVQAGIPMVTLEGNHHSARFASAVFKQMNVPELITHTIEEYIEKAIELAYHKDKRAIISNKLKANAHLIFEDMDSVKELEAFFLSEYEKLRSNY